VKNEWSQEKLNYLKEIYDGRTKKEMIELMCIRFAPDKFSVNSISHAMERLNVKSTIQHRFQKGVSNRRKEIFSERVDSNGYVEIKVGNPSFWKRKHAYIWESANNMAVPKGHVIIFADRNKNNFDIENLKLVSREELAFLNKYRLITEDMDVTNAAVNLAKLKGVARKLRTCEEE